MAKPLFDESERLSSEPNLGVMTRVPEPDPAKSKFHANTTSPGLFHESERAPATMPHGDVNVPSPEEVTRPEETEDPGVLASAIRGVGEGIGVGPIARRITAAGRTYLLPEALGGNDKSYEENLADEEARTQAAAEKNALPYAAGRVGGGIYAATKLGPAALAGLVFGNGLLEGGSVTDAAKNAALSYALGKAAPAAPRAVAGVGSGMGIYNAFNAPNEGEALASVGDALTGLAGAASGHARFGKMHEDALTAGRRAEADVRANTQAVQDAAGQKIAGMEGAAQKDVERQNAQTDRANIARANAAESVVKQEVGEKARDAREQRSEAYHQQGKVYNAARDAARTQAKAENDQRRLARLDREDRWDAEDAQYAKDQATRQQYLDQLRERNAKVDEQYKVLRKIEKEKARLQGEYQRRQDEILSEFKGALDDVDPAGIPASVMGKIGEMFRETHTRLANLHAGAERNGLALPENYRDLDKYVTETLIKNTPRKFADLEEYKANPRAWIEKQIADAKAKGDGAPEAPLTEAPPDFEKQARENVEQDEAANAALNERARKAAEAAVPPLASSEPPEPVRPDRTVEKAAIRDMERQKILAGPKPLPPKPDATQRALDTLHGHQSARAEEEARIRDVRSDPGLVLDKRDAINSSPTSPRPLNDAVEAAIAQGRENVRRDLPQNRTIAEQYIREQGPSALSKVLRVGAPVAAGGVAGTLIGGPVGGAVGTSAGLLANHLLNPKTEKVVAPHLKTRLTTDGLAPGAAPVKRFANPNEAAAIYRDVVPELAKKHLASKRQATVLGRGAIQTALTAPNFIEHLKKHRGEER